MKSRFSEEQIIAILKQHQAGVPVADLCRKHGVSHATLYSWRSRFGGMEVLDARRLTRGRGAAGEGSFAATCLPSHRVRSEDLSLCLASVGRCDRSKATEGSDLLPANWTVFG